MGQALEPGEPILAAASGGGDSTALVVLLAEAARDQKRHVVACVIDHALREGSADDAARAREILAGLGAEVILHRLDWPHGPKASQAAARQARYAALAEIARAQGGSTLFLGHTWDDQAETTFMRREADSGSRGLAAMAAFSPCPVWPQGRDLTLARPLLGVRRETLRELLRNSGVGWIEDPANALQRFARVRARATLAQTGESAALVESAALAGEAAAALDAGALRLLETSVRLMESEAELHLTPQPEDPVQVRLVSALACAFGAADREPSPAGAARILARLAGGGGGGLAGACFKPASPETGAPIRLARDPGGVNGRRGGGTALAELALAPGVETVWDGRLLLRATGPGWAVRSGGGSGAPQVSQGEGTLESRWLVADRVRMLLWRAPGWRNGPRIAPSSRGFEV